MKHLLYSILTLCFLTVLVCQYTPMQNPVAVGDAKWYRQMAVTGSSEGVPHPFHHRTFVPSLARCFPSVDVGFFAIAFTCLWLTGLVVRATMLSLSHSEEVSSLSGFLYLATFWCTGFNLQDFWLSDPLINLLVWLGILCLARKEYVGLLLFGLAFLVKGASNPLTWETVSAASTFAKPLAALMFCYGFLWLGLSHSNYRILAICAVLFVAGHLVATDLNRVAATTLAFPVLQGVCLALDKYKLPPLALAALLFLHLWQQGWWVFAK